MLFLLFFFFLGEGGGGGGGPFLIGLFSGSQKDNSPPFWGPLEKTHQCEYRLLLGFLQQLSQKECSVLSARRYWGAVPETASAAAWRASLKRHCPVLHDVMLEDAWTALSLAMLRVLCTCSRPCASCDLKKAAFVAVRLNHTDSANMA